VYENVDRIQLAMNRVEKWGLVNKVMNFGFLIKRRALYLSSSANITLRAPYEIRLPIEA
jgi:hypothetical protein